MAWFYVGSEERERDAASHTGRSFASSCNVGSPNGHVVTQQTCLAYCPGLSLLSPPVFCFRVERSPVSRYTRNIRPEIYRRFANLEQRAKQLPSPVLSLLMELDGWPLQILLYYDVSIRRAVQFRGRGRKERGWKWRKIQRWNLQSTIAWSFIARRELRIKLSPRVGSATDKSTELWRIMEGLSTIK